MGEKEISQAVPSRQSESQRFLGWAGVGPGAWRGSRGGVVEIEVNGEQVSLEIDSERGPKLCNVDGSTGWLPSMQTGQQWSKRDSVAQKCLAYQAARMNSAAQKARPEFERQARERALVEERARAERALQGLRKTLAEALRKGNPREIMEARCAVELARAPVPWTLIAGDTVLANHTRRAPGMIYNLDFPWTEELLEEFGPGWLTEAFHTAGTLDRSNRVVTLTVDKSIKIDAGNNAGKFLFEVTYERLTPDLDTKLFAKIPFKFTDETKSDRISSSVLKQPMDLHEINTYRLIEAAFPMKTPKFYYGDISNETSNFILITARIPYAEVGRAKVGEGKLEPFQIEGPYDKCKDAIQLRGSAKDYYVLLMLTSAKIAGLDKAGKMCSEDVLRSSLRPVPADPTNPSAWGCNPSAPTGEAPAMMQNRLSQAIKYFGDTARVVFPEYATSTAFQNKFVNTMMTWSAYNAELQYWLHSDMDYVALGHNNLNADNAYFWRDDAGKLDCGVIDWGGFGAGPLGHKMWWSFNCADFDQFRDNVNDYIDNFIAAYRESGGPQLDKDLFKKHVLITSLGNMMFMVRAVPDCLKMCSVKEWATIQDRHDPRIADNVNGKSTLRTTLHVLNNGMRVLEEMGSDKVLKAWIEDVYVGKWGKMAKTDAIIFGK